MKVSFFDFTVNFGGAPQGSVYLMKRLKNAGNDCSIIDAYGSSKDYKNKVVEYDLNYYVLYPQDGKVTIGFKGQPLMRSLNILGQLNNLLSVTIALFKTLKKIQPDVVIVNNEKSLFFLNAVSHLLDFRVVLYFRGEGTKSQLSDRFLKSLKSKTDHVVAHSKLAVSNLEKAGIPSDKLTYIPNCIELEKFKLPAKSEDITASKKFRVILPAARLVREKGYHVAIEAINILKKEGYSIDLFLPGTTAKGDNYSYKEYLEGLIDKYELENDVHFIGWRNNLISDIAACNLVVLPSHTEGFPRSVIEAMIHGIPVCATPVGGIPEAIKHMETGLLFKVEDTNGLVDNVRLLIDKPNLYDAISNKAYKFSRDYFDPQRNTDGILNVLHTI